MPDFTVIEGGGDTTAHQREIAKWKFRDLAVEVMRLAGNGGVPYRAGIMLEGFYNCCADHELNYVRAIEEGMAELHAEAFETERGLPFQAEEMALLLSALRLIAESSAADGAAKARQSSRKHAFNQAIEAYIVRREQVAREDGWSYTEEVMKRAGLMPRALLSRQRQRKKPRVRNSWDER